MIDQPTDEDIARFINEDLGKGDLTAAIIPENTRANALVTSRDKAVVCGKAWFNAVFTHLNADVTIHWRVEEGQLIAPDTTLCKVNGPARSLLSGERTALNLLQTLSATATTSRRYADAVSGTGCKVLDTRKTLPGLRMAQKYAVSCGGCFNHRIGLFDAILIKENHIFAAGSITRAIETARKQPNVMVEVEVENMEEFHQALSAGPDRIMLDNFSLQDLMTAVKTNNHTTELEASGNITLENIRQIAETGVDYISIGALTKHLHAIDLSMRITLDEI